MNKMRGKKCMDWKQEMWMLSIMSTFERFDFREMERLIEVIGKSVGGAG